MTFAERLRELRKEKGMTLEDIGQAIGVGRATVYKYEHGIITNIPLDKINQLAQIFNVGRPYLMGWTDNRTMTMPEVTILTDNVMFLKAYTAMTTEEREILSDLLIKSYARYQEE